MPTRWRARLADAVAGHVEITQAVQANAVFAILPPGRRRALQQDFHFYVWDEHTGEVRWMCAWDTTEADVDAFAAAIVRVAAASLATLGGRWPRRSIHRPRSWSPGMSAST